MRDNARIRRLREHGQPDRVALHPAFGRNLAVEEPDIGVDSGQNRLDVFVAIDNQGQSVLRSSMKSEEIAERPAKETRLARFAHQIFIRNLVVLDLIVASQESCRRQFDSRRQRTDPEHKRRARIGHDELARLRNRETDERRFHRRQIRKGRPNAILECFCAFLLREFSLNGLCKRVKKKDPLRLQHLDESRMQNCHEGGSLVFLNAPRVYVRTIPLAIDKQKRAHEHGPHLTRIGCPGRRSLSPVCERLDRILVGLYEWDRSLLPDNCMEALLTAVMKELTEFAGKVIEQPAHRLCRRIRAPGVREDV